MVFDERIGFRYCGCLVLGKKCMMMSVAFSLEILEFTIFA